MPTMQQAWGRVKLTEVNPHLVCVLCHGYFIDATTMAECPHSFCRSCIILYLETKSYCPICEVQIHKTKPHLNLKPDKTLQDIVYKLVPGLFHSEMRRRREFYAKHPNHDLYLNPEARGVGVERIIYSPEDSISLSLEYYDDEREREEWTSAQPGLGDIEKKSPNRPGDGLKRYLQCPAVVTISQIKKFIRMKYNLSATCTVEVLYRRESLPDSYSLMDIAYIYTWKKNGPMRFYYRIHVSVPVAQTLPALEKPKITEETETKLEDPSLVKLTKSAIESSLCAVENKETADDINTSPIVRKSEDTNCIPSENQSKVEDNSAIIRPYASEHDELSVSLLLSLSNGHQRETNVESETDKKQSEHTNIKSTPAIGTLNHQIPAISQKLKNVESKIEASKTMPTVQSVSSPGTVNGYNQHSKTSKAIVNGPTKLFVKKSIPKPPIKCNANVKNNGQIIKNILATKLTENSNKSLPKSIQIIGEAITNTTRDQNKTPPEGKQLQEENKSNLDAHITCQTTSQKQLTIAEKVLKSTKYLPSSLIKNNLKKIDSVNNIASLQKSEFNPDKVMSTPINKPMLENKDLSCAENKTISITTNHQEKNETKAKETTSNNIQPIHRKEINRLEQIVKNCMKKGNNSMLNKQTESNLSNGQASKMENGEEAVKQTSPQNSSSKDGLSSSSNTMINCPNKELAAPLEVDTAKEKTTILKRKLKDPTCFISVNRDNSNLLGPPDPKKRRLVTPDVSIELTTNPAHENKKNPFIRPAECSDLSILTKRFLNSIQQMKKHTNAYQEFNIKDIDQLCASNVKIEKVPASHVNSSSHKILQNTLVKNDEKDKPTTDNKDNLKHKKKDDLVSIAIERINENIRMTEKSNDVTTDTQENKDTINPEPVPSTSGDKESLPSPSSLKKLPRLIEINAPPRPKLQTTLQDSKQRTGLKMTTVRKEVPIGKEGPLVRKDNTGALDLSSGSPGSPKHKPATNQRPVSSSKSPSSLSPLQAMSSFQVPEMKTLPPLRIPNLKHKTPPLLQPRPSSLSSSSPSPPADSRTSELFSSTAFQHLYRHQLELQSRLMASSQINNTKWRQDPLSAKKFEEWMRNVMNCGGLPPHPLMFQSQLGSSSDTHRK